MTAAAELISIERARELVLERCRPLEAEPVALRAARGRTLAADATAAERVPGFDNSAMDGFAVRAADLAGASSARPVALRIAAESRAGAPATATLGGGEAIAISTGAVIPAGCDAVIRVEDTRRPDDRSLVECVAAVEPGQNLRRAGDDIEPGALLLSAGSVLGAVEIGVLASVGIADPGCRRRPSVSILSTGDELVGVEGPLAPGSVRNSNAYALPALAESAGARVDAVARAADDSDSTRAAIERGLATDALVISGGISVGEHDHVKGALAELRVEQVFWGVSLKPGKPAWFGVAPGGTLVFGLPGNPVSAYVTFLLFVRPALLALQGADPARARTEARLAAAYSKPPDRAHAIRCGLELTAEGWVATAAPHQGSHVMTSLLGADALALIPAEAEQLEPGATVTVELLDRGLVAGSLGSGR